MWPSQPFGGTRDAHGPTKPVARVACTLSAQVLLCGRLHDLFQTIAASKRETFDVHLLQIDNAADAQTISASLAFQLARDMNGVEQAERCECGDDTEAAIVAAFKIARWLAIAHPKDVTAFVHAGLDSITTLEGLAAPKGVHFIDVRDILKESSESQTSVGRERKNTVPIPRQPSSGDLPARSADDPSHVVVTAGETADAPTTTPPEDHAAATEDTEGANETLSVGTHAQTASVEVIGTDSQTVDDGASEESLGAAIERTIMLIVPKSDQVRVE